METIRLPVEVVITVMKTIDSRVAVSEIIHIWRDGSWRANPNTVGPHGFPSRLGSIGSSGIGPDVSLRLATERIPIPTGVTMEEVWSGSRLVAVRVELGDHDRVYMLSAQCLEKSLGTDRDVEYREKILPEDGNVLRVGYAYLNDGLWRSLVDLPVGILQERSQRQFLVDCLEIAFSS